MFRSMKTGHDNPHTISSDLVEILSELTWSRFRLLPSVATAVLVASLSHGFTPQSATADDRYQRMLSQLNDQLLEARLAGDAQVARSLERRIQTIESVSDPQVTGQSPSVNNGGGTSRTTRAMPAENLGETRESPATRPDPTREVPATGRRNPGDPTGEFPEIDARNNAERDRIASQTPEQRESERLGALERAEQERLERVRNSSPEELQRSLNDARSIHDNVTEMRNARLEQQSQLQEQLDALPKIEHPGPLATSAEKNEYFANEYARDRLEHQLAEARNNVEFFNGFADETRQGIAQREADIRHQQESRARADNPDAAAREPMPEGGADDPKSTRPSGGEASPAEGRPQSRAGTPGETAPQPEGPGIRGNVESGVGKLIEADLLAKAGGVGMDLAEGKTNGKDVLNQAANAASFGVAEKARDAVAALDNVRAEQRAYDQQYAVEMSQWLRTGGVPASERADIMRAMLSGDRKPLDDKLADLQSKDVGLAGDMPVRKTASLESDDFTARGALNRGAGALEGMAEGLINAPGEIVRFSGRVGSKVGELLNEANASKEDGKKDSAAQLAPNFKALGKSDRDIELAINARNDGFPYEYNRLVAQRALLAANQNSLEKLPPDQRAAELEKLLEKAIRLRPDEMDADAIIKDIARYPNNGSVIPDLINDGIPHDQSVASHGDVEDFNEPVTDLDNGTEDEGLGDDFDTTPFRRAQLQRQARALANTSDREEARRLGELLADRERADRARKDQQRRELRDQLQQDLDENARRLAQLNDYRRRLAQASEDSKDDEDIRRRMAAARDALNDWERRRLGEGTPIDSRRSRLFGAPVDLTRESSSQTDLDDGEVLDWRPPPDWHSSDDGDGISVDADDLNWDEDEDDLTLDDEDVDWPGDDPPGDDGGSNVPPEPPPEDHPNHPDIPLVDEPM